MNLKELQYLVALAEHQHFGRAAHATFVSQPTLSMQIKKLEEELGVQLLERTNKLVRLTPVGKSLAERARGILQAVNELRMQAQIYKDPAAGELKLGIIPTLAPYLLPHIVPLLHKVYPNLTLYLLELKTDAIIKKLRQGEIDIAILALPVVSNELITTELFAEDFYLAVPKLHHLAKNKCVKIEDISSETLLLLEEGHCLRGQALAVCHLNQANGFDATSLETLRQMVVAGVGVTFMPKLACEAFIHAAIKYLPFAKPAPQRQIGMLWRVTSPRQALHKEIAGHIKNWWQQYTKNNHVEG